MRDVTVQFYKNPDIPHWGFEAVWLGEDEWGRWIAVPRGSNRWKGDEPKRPTSNDAVFCAPHEGWWHLHYNGPTTEYSHFVDIVTPPIWVSEHRYEMIDLDLDVVVRSDGTIEVQDEDEFEAHQLRYGYSPEMIARAELETAHVATALRNREEPFLVVAEHWLTRSRRVRPD